MTGAVVVTGGGQGLGRAFCHAFAQSGRRVVVADRNPQSANRVAQEIGGFAVEVDVASESSVESMAAQLVAEVGTVDVLVNNAAVFSTLQIGAFTDISVEAWTHVMAVNVTGAFLCCRAIVPGMQRAGYGKVINISSATIFTGRAGYLHYVTSKAALIGLTRSLASEVGPDGVRVNAITPGSTDTEIKRETITSEARLEMAQQTALRRVQVPDDVVGAVLFLASPESDFITGQTLNVDGGLAFH